MAFALALLFALLLAAATGHPLSLPHYTPMVVGVVIVASVAASTIVRAWTEIAAARVAAVNRSATPTVPANPRYLRKAMAGWELVGLLGIAAMLLILVAPRRKFGPSGEALFAALAGLLTALQWICLLYLYERVRAWRERRPAQEPRGVWAISALGLLWTIAVLVFISRA
jgi:hypothetical protein